MKELYSLLLSSYVVELVRGKLVSAVASVGCKNVGVMTIVMRAMTSGVTLLG